MQFFFSISVPSERSYLSISQEQKERTLWTKERTIFSYRKTNWSSRKALCWHDILSHIVEWIKHASKSHPALNVPLKSVLVLIALRLHAALQRGRGSSLLRWQSQKNVSLFPHPVFFISKATLYSGM